MLISGKHGYVFAACSKNASTSIEGILAPDSDVTLTRPGKKLFKHVPISVIKDHFAPLFTDTAPYEDYFSFGIVRDPVKRAVAKFNYRSTFKPDHLQYCGHMQFDQFLDELCGKDPPPRSQVNSQARFFGYDGETMKVDFLMRLENLVDDAKPLGDRLGVNLAEAIAASHRNKNEEKRINVRDLTEEQYDRIDRRFSKDRRLYRHVFRSHRDGWGAVLDKPKPATTSEALRASQLKHMPKLAAESLYNRMRLDLSMTLEDRLELREEVLKLDPDKKLLKRLFKPNYQLKR